MVTTGCIRAGAPMVGARQRVCSNGAAQNKLVPLGAAQSIALARLISVTLCCTKNAQRVGGGEDRWGFRHCVAVARKPCSDQLNRVLRCSERGSMVTLQGTQGYA